MITKIEVIKVIYDCYERFYKFQLVDNREIFIAHGIDTEYIQSGSKLYTNPEVRLAELSIEWVLAVEKINNNTDDKFIQTIKDSTHVECIGKIIEIISSESLTLEIENYGLFLVILEYNESFLQIGDKIKFRGDLKIEFL